MNTPHSVFGPLLIVRGAAQAIDFYVRALGAKLSTCHEHGVDRRISHADLFLRGLWFSITEEAREWNSDAPVSLGGSPVVLQLYVEDAQRALASMCHSGASVVFPLQDLLGERMARVRDPFGHLWLIRQQLEELSSDELQRRRDELFAQLAPTPPQQARHEDESSVQDPYASKQPPTGRVAALGPTAGAGTLRPRAHLIVGPVGAGKSTFARRLAAERSALRLTLDEWITSLFSPDRPGQGVMEWYRERAARCIDQIWRVAEASLAAGSDVVLEIGLLTRGERERFYRRVDSAGFDLSVYLLDASRDVRRERVEQRNRSKGVTFSMVVPPAIFELASDLWEAPDERELDSREIHVVRTDLE